MPGEEGVMLVEKRLLFKHDAAIPHITNTA